MCKKIVGIYLIKNNITRRVRVGSSKDCQKRWSNYLACLRNGIANKKMQEDYGNYGEQSFEFIILEICLVKDLFTREKYYLEEVYDDVSFYNANRVISKVKKFKTGLKAKEHKQHFRDMFSGENNPNCTKLNQQKANEILWMKNNTELSQKEIGDLYNVSPNMVSRIGNDRWVNSVESIPETYLDESKVC